MNINHADAQAAFFILDQINGLRKLLLADRTNDSALNKSMKSEISTKLHELELVLERVFGA